MGSWTRPENRAFLIKFLLQIDGIGTAPENRAFSRKPWRRVPFLIFKYLSLKLLTVERIISEQSFRTKSHKIDKKRVTVGDFMRSSSWGF